MDVFVWIEHTPIALWVRESVWGFPLSLIVHAWAMAFLVGISLLLALSVLRRMPRVLLPLLDKCIPFTWLAFALSLLSGVFLLSAYPAKALTNEVFYLKLVFIAVALSLVVSLKNYCQTLAVSQETVFPLAAKVRAVGILLAWFSTIAAGRLLAYTYSILTVG